LPLKTHNLHTTTTSTTTITTTNMEDAALETRCTYVYTIKMDLKGVECEVVDWI